MLPWIQWVSLGLQLEPHVWISFHSVKLSPFKVCRMIYQQLLFAVYPSMYRQLITELLLYWIQLKSMMILRHVLLPLFFLWILSVFMEKKFWMVGFICPGFEMLSRLCNLGELAFLMGNIEGPNGCLFMF